MIAGALLLAMLVMKLWPETPSARFLHRTLVEQPLALIGRLSRRQLVFLLIGLLVLQGAAMAGLSLDLATLMAIDVSTYVDAMITVWTIAALTRSRQSWHAVRARLPGLRRKPRPRARRSRTSPMRERGPANDEDGAARPLAA